MFPICDGTHWFLILAVRPGDISNIIFSNSPFLYLFDSLPGDRSTALEDIREYLAQEWLEKMMIPDQEARLPTFSQSEMKLITPVIPGQDNVVDCGLFLLTYSEKVFERQESFNIVSKCCIKHLLSAWKPSLGEERFLTCAGGLQWKKFLPKGKES